MTNEEAIKLLSNVNAQSPLAEALRLAVKALENKNVIKCETAEKHNKKCLGYQKSEQDDEPIEECEKCLLYDGLRE